MALRLSTIAHTSFGDGSGQHVEIATTGILEGDLVLVFFNADGNSNLNDANFTPDAGFTAPASLLNTQSAPDGSSYRICYKVATASEPANYDFVNTAYATMYPMMVVLSGRAGTVSIGSWITNTSSNSSVITADYNSYTAAAGDDVVAFASLDKTNFDAQWTYSAITGFTTAQSTLGNSHGGGWESSMYGGVLEAASAGSSTPSQTITNTSGGGSAGFANIIILAPASGGGGGGSEGVLVGRRDALINNGVLVK